jgi:hypothetical protein
MATAPKTQTQPQQPGAATPSPAQSTQSQETPSQQQAVIFRDYASI